MSQDLIARLAAAEAEVAAVRAELAKAQEPEPWERWKPKENQRYYFLSDSGALRMSIWDGGSLDQDRLAFGNVQPTPEAAERHALRIRSMVPTCAVPKVGDMYWFPVVDDLRFAVGHPREWKGDAADRFYFNRGQVFDSPESCAEWIAEFGDPWTTLEVAS